MSNPSKAKGSAWERRVVDYLAAHGHPNAERRALEGVNDRGDVAGIASWIVECKNAREWRLGEWMREAEREALTAGVSRFAVVIPQKGRATELGYAVLPLWLLGELMLPDTTCPYIVTGDEGTSYCSLGERQYGIRQVRGNGHRATTPVQRPAVMTTQGWVRTQGGKRVHRPTCRTLTRATTVSPWYYPKHDDELAVFMELRASGANGPGWNWFCSVCCPAADRAQRGIT